MLRVGLAPVLAVVLMLVAEFKAASRMQAPF
jgi:hypothetical protein